MEIKPYTDYLFIEPEEKKQILVAETGNLQTVGKVIAVSPEVIDTKIGDVVVFEIWDLKDFGYNEKKYYCVAENKAICKIV